MKKRYVPFIAFGTVFSLTACGLFSRHIWNWETSTINDTISYCLLIGQEDHNDSNDRTAGIRNIFHTQTTDPSKRKPLANLEEPEEGWVILNGDTISGGTIPTKQYVVKELEHREQKSLAGTTWDPITANGSAATWTAKHGKNITMFISNNDGMAEGAIGASCWYQGMPIFGYDANKSTLRFIKKGRIMGTIDSNTPTQCLTSYMLIRNICDHYAKYPNDDTKFNPCSIGFKTYESKVEGWDKQPFGYVTSNVTFDGCSDDDIDKDANHALLVNNFAITDFEDVGKYFEGAGDKAVSVNDYFDKDGNDKKPEVRAAEAEPNVLKGDGKRLKVLQSYYSNTDVYFNGNMDPFFNYFASEKLNLDVVRRYGDGANEKPLVEDVCTTISGQGPFDAILLNVIKQPSASLYVTEVAKALKIEKKAKWEDRSPIPLIFWNRQPTDIKGEVLKDVMHNEYFKYTYYVGFDAKQGGKLQGIMINSWLNTKYVEVEKAKKAIIYNDEVNGYGKH